MKYLIPFIIAAVAMLTACSNDELVSINTEGSNIIRFNTSVDKSTRATDITVDNIGDADSLGFAIFGWTAAKKSDGSGYDSYAQIFNDEKVIGSDGNYTYKNLQYWEPGNKYTFHAIAPYGNDDAKNASAWKRHWDNFTVSGDNQQIASLTFNNTGEQDLVYSYKTVNDAKEIGNNPVDLQFSHLLSRVRFCFVGTSDNPNSVEINVTNVTLTGAYDSGKITLNDTNVTDDWKFDNAGTEEISFGGIAAKDIFTTQESGVYTAHKYLIPADESKIYGAEIELKLTAGVGSGESATTHTYNPTITLEELPAIKMEKGKSYVYKIGINTSTSTDNNVIDPIIFNVEAVEEWDSYITLPNSVTLTVHPKSTTSKTDILGKFGNYEGKNTLPDATWTGEFDLSQVDAIYIDEQKQDTVEYSYLMTEDKDYTVMIVMKDNFTSAHCMFYACEGITKFDFSNLNTSKVTDMSYMFQYCKGISNSDDIDLSPLDTSSLENMFSMFGHMDKLTKIIISFDTSNVTNLKWTFGYSQFTEIWMINGGTIKATSFDDTFYSHKSSGKFYYNSDYTYDNILKAVPSGWDKIDIKTLSSTTDQ
jgi:surface protein